MHNFFKFRQKVADQGFKHRACLALPIIWLCTSVQLLLYKDLSIQSDWRLSHHYNLVNCFKFLNFDFNEACHVSTNVSHFNVRPSNLGHVLNVINAFIFSCLNVLPKVVVETLEPTHELLFGLGVFHQVWEFLTELVERSYKLIYHFLFLAGPLEELNECSLALVKINDDSFILLLDLCKSC